MSLYFGKRYFTELKDAVEKNFYNKILNFIDELSYDQVERIIAQAFSDTKNLYNVNCFRVGEFEDTKSKAMYHLNWLLRTSKDYSYEDTRIPAYDHAIRITNNKKERTLLLQPYHLNYSTMIELVEWCNNYGLEADITTHSGYFPGQTLAIRITKKNERK